MKKLLIVTGGRVSKEFVRRTIEEYRPNVIVAADRGMMVLHELSVLPDYLVGDFDSGENAVLEEFRSRFSKEGRPIIRSFNPEKDETDTELAISMSIGLEPSEILILGGTGTRLDHTLANVGLLRKITEAGIVGYLADEYNIIRLHDEAFTLKKGEGEEFFSFLPFGDRVTGLTIEGAKYEIKDYDLELGSSLCISNEFQKKEVRVKIGEGRLLSFQTSDEKREFFKG